VNFKPGSRLRSQVCETQDVVVHAAADDIDLQCGGKPMIDAAAAMSEPGIPAPGLDTGAQLGKRYRAGDESGLEVLVVSGGDGTLSIDSIPLTVKAAKALPSSD
jgi:hypothetical protein